MQVRQTIKFYLLLITTVFVGSISCTYDVMEMDNECGIGSPSFSSDVQAIFSGGCVSCHNGQFASGGIALDDYDAVKEVVDNNRLLGAIRHDSGFSAMPQGGPMLPMCAIETISIWIDNGASNN